MKEIKKLLIKRKFKTKFLNFLRYVKRLLVNKGIITIFYKNRTPFYDIWKKQIINDLDFANSTGIFGFCPDATA